MTTLERTIAEVSKRYGDVGSRRHGDDEVIQAYFDDDAGGHGDTLAQFIVRELRKIYADPKLSDGERLQRAIQHMEWAKQDLSGVIVTFRKLQASTEGRDEYELSRISPRRVVIPRCVHCLADLPATHELVISSPAQNDIVLPLCDECVRKVRPLIVIARSVQSSAQIDRASPGQERNQ